MRFKKRHFILFILALLPFIKLIHVNDYCFGDIDLLLVAIFSVPFVMAFLTLLFYNFYKITLRVELFNFITLAMAVLFSVGLFIAIKYHDTNPFKNKVEVFNTIIDAKSTAEIILFNDKTFELKTIVKDCSCYKKGVYYYKNDSLFLEKLTKNEKDTIFDNVYSINKMYNTLKPTNNLLPEFILKK